MKKLWFPLAALILAGCSQDKTLGTLIPRESLAVVLMDHPSFVIQALGSRVGDFPWDALDGDKPWAAAMIPSSSPGFLLALALGKPGTSWDAVQVWARDKGGLNAVRFGTYAVLVSPGLPAPAVLEPSQRFDLTRVRVGGAAAAVYIDSKNWIGHADLPGVPQPFLAFLPQVSKDLAGVRATISPRDGGLELRVSTDWKEGAAEAMQLKEVGLPADLSSWTGQFVENQGFGVAVSLPPQAMGAVGSLTSDPSLARRWAALAPLLGPRLAVSAVHRADGSWAWSAAVEARDPQAVRQALKTLVASGDLQRHFTDWAMDADTPLIYQDKPEATGVRTQVVWGIATVQLAYGEDRVALAGGAGALDAVGVWKRPPAAPAPWYREAPADASVVGGGAIDGLGARGAVRILSDGNLEIQIWIDNSELRVWEERVGQAFPPWPGSKGSPAGP